MFVDLGHFSVPIIQIAFTSEVLPCLLEPLWWAGLISTVLVTPLGALSIIISDSPFVWLTMYQMCRSKIWISLGKYKVHFCWCPLVCLNFFVYSLGKWDV